MSVPPVEASQATKSPDPPATAAWGVSSLPDRSLLALLVLLAALPYFNILFNAFTYDDNTQVLNNPYIQSFRHLREIFSTTVWSTSACKGFPTTIAP